MKSNGALEEFFIEEFKTLRHRFQVTRDKLDAANREIAELKEKINGSEGTEPVSIPKERTQADRLYGSPASTFI